MGKGVGETLVLSCAVVAVVVCRVTEFGFEARKGAEVGLDIGGSHQYDIPI